MYLKLITVFTLLVGGQTLIRDCDPSSVFRPIKLELSPDPPIQGKQISLTVIFNNTGQPVTDGTVSTSISINRIPFTSISIPLCHDTVCPIVSGLNDRSTTAMFPSISGLIKGRVTWTGAQGESLLCIDTAVKVSPVLTWNLFGMLRRALKNNKKEIDELQSFFSGVYKGDNVKHDASQWDKHSFFRVYDENKQEVQSFYKKIEELAKNKTIVENMFQLSSDEEFTTKIPEAEHETV
jgi:hypothetical protein